MKTLSSYTWPAALILFFMLSFSAPGMYIDDPEALVEEPVLARVMFKDQSELNQFAASFDIWEVNHEQGYALAYLKPGEFQALTLQGYLVVIDQNLTSQIQGGSQLAARSNWRHPGFSMLPDR